MANQIDQNYLSWLKLLRWTRLDFFFKTSFLLNFHLICMSALLDHENCRLQMDIRLQFFFERDRKIGKHFIIPKLFYLTWFYEDFFFKLNLVNLQHFPFPVVAFFHIQNSSNCCRHNNDRSISRVFYLFFLFFQVFDCPRIDPTNVWRQKHDGRLRSPSR